MTTGLERVLRPGRIGRLPLPHRIVMGAMHLGWENRDDDGRALAAFYLARVTGGAGLMVTGGAAVSAAGADVPGYGVLDDAAFRARLRRVAGEVAESGAPAVQPPAAATLELVPVWNSLYCRNVAGAAPTWVAGGTTDFAAHWTARRQHEHVATITAPAGIAEEWSTIAAFTRDVATPMVEAGDLDGPPTEPSAVVGARARVAAFDHEVCEVA